MQQFLNQLLALIQQAIALVFQLVLALQAWTFGQIGRVINAPWQNWTIWKQLVALIVLAGIGYLLYRAGMMLWEALVGLFKSVVNVGTVLITASPWIAGAGLLAWGGGWVVLNLRF